MISLSGIFNRVMNRPALSPVSIPMRDVEAALRLDHNGYFDNPDIAWAFGQHLQSATAKRRAQTRSYYINRAEYFHVGTLTSSFSDVADMELNIRGAASISIQRLKPFAGPRKFAAMIQPRILRRDQLSALVLFGLTGTLDAGDRLHVDSILLPRFNGRVQEGLSSVPVTDETLRQAMIFARLCADDIFSGKSPDGSRNLSEARRGAARAEQPSPEQK